MGIKKVKKQVHIDDRENYCPLCDAYGHIPNAETRAALEEAHEGKNPEYIDEIDAFMDSICAD